MFRILCYCEDKDLGRVKVALAHSGARNVQDTPIVNAEFDDNGDVRATMRGNTKLEIVYNALLARPTKRVTLDEICAIAVRDAGSNNRSSGAQLAHQLKSRHLLKHLGPKSYEVMGWKPKRSSAKKPAKKAAARKSAKKSAKKSHVNGSATL